MKISNRYFSLRSYLKQRFGSDIRRIPVNGGFWCPNRDGLKGTSGCTFCDVSSFSPVSNSVDSPVQQIHRALEYNNLKNQRIIVYFQPYSNTYGTVEQLMQVYEPVLMIPNVVGIALGTRPDCLEKPIIEYLSYLNTKTYVCVELGLQSGSDSTLQKNNRGHSVQDFVTAVHQLHEKAIHCVGHMILGLPGDAEADIFNTASLCSELPLHGVKLHQLMVIAHTKIEQWFNEGLVQPLSLEAYCRVVSECLMLLKPDQVIYRLVANATQEDGCISPLWSTNKTKTLQIVHTYLQDHDIIQGKKYKQK